MGFFFVYDVKECSNFIILHVTVQFSQHHLLKRLSFLHCIFFLPLLSWINWHKHVALLLGSLSYSIDLCVCFVLAPYGFDFCSLVVVWGLPWWLGWYRTCLQCGRPRFDPLEKEMATHSSILAWEIPWTEEAAGLHSMGSQESDMMATKWLSIYRT